MVICAVIGCHNRSGRDPIKFFSLHNTSENNGPIIQELSLERRNLWLSRISRDEPPTKDWRVCAKHFIAGKELCSYHSIIALCD